jgi:hypothetical protein
MRRWAMSTAVVVLLLGIGATAWAQGTEGPTETTEPQTTVPQTTVPQTTVPVTTFPPTTDPSSTSTTMCAIGTTTTFCFPVSTPPPTSEPPDCDCDGRFVVTSSPAKYAERAQEPGDRNLSCFNIRLVSVGTFVVSASGDQKTLDWLFGR